MNSIVAFVFILTVLSVKATYDFDHYDEFTTVLAPFYFGYIKNHDTLSARLYFYSWSTAVNYSFIFQYQGPGNGSNTKRVLIEENKVFLLFYKQLLYDRISLHLMSETEGGWCKNMTIIDGMAVNRIQSGPGYEYDSSCLRSSPCKIRVHLQNDCTDVTSDTADKPRIRKKHHKLMTTTVTPSDTDTEIYNIFNSDVPTTPRDNFEPTSKKSSVVKTNVISVTADKPRIRKKDHKLKTATVTPSDTDTENFNIFNSDVPTTPRDNFESTSKKSSVVKTSENTSITVIVLSSLFSMLIVLVIIAFWIYCWNKRNPQGTHIARPNHTEPFYLNMLFRRECDQEIAEIEEHQYEEIGPRVVEGT